MSESQRGRRRTAAPIVVGLACGPMAALGFARFAYSLLLPSMQADLSWSFAQAGAMNTANAAGYLAGAVLAGPVIARRGSRGPYLVGLAVTALAVLASAATANFAALLVLRLLAGVSGALVFIAGAGLVAEVVAGRSAHRAAVLLGVYFAGAGVGIVISAVAVTPLVDSGGAAWRWGWVALGVASAAVLAASWPAARRAPEPARPPRQRVLGWPLRRLGPTLAAYPLFGAGYIAYVTFIVSFLRSEGLGTVAVVVFWSILGLAAVVGAFAWGPVLGRLKGGRGPALVLITVTVGALLPSVLGGALGAYLSAALFGGSFLALVTANINLARRSLRPHQVAPAIAVLTVAFGVGQCVGPVLAGVLSDGPSGVRAGLRLSVGLLVVAVIVAAVQREPHPGGVDDLDDGVLRPSR